MATTSPAGALNAANTLVHDPAKSQELFFSLAMEWKQQQPADFASWLQDTSLVSSPQKQRLLNREFHADRETPVPAPQATGAGLINGREGR